jgi:hypothetical protein
MCTDVIASHGRHIETDELASTWKDETDIICHNHKRNLANNTGGGGGGQTDQGY